MVFGTAQVRRLFQQIRELACIGHYFSNQPMPITAHY
jgi:hypothetical protein